MLKHKNLLYVIPDLNKVSGGPRTRISMFKKVFEDKGDRIIEGKNKFLKSIRTRNIDLTYIESATNRISLIDFLSLIFIRMYSKEIIVFIRDIYAELFTDEFITLRKKITFYANRLSYFYLVLLTDKIVFPTSDMGKIFYQKNKYFPKREFFSLPPGTKEREVEKKLPDFTKKVGILYLGGISYSNSGFDLFLNFADQYKHKYKFFMLSGDQLAKVAISDRTHIYLDRIPHSLIDKFITDHNICFAFHSRPRNEYDDITFPIKVMDFITFRLPFITANHQPLINLLGTEYELFLDISKPELIDRKIEFFSERDSYCKLLQILDEVSTNNTYEKRYEKLFAK